MSLRIKDRNIKLAYVLSTKYYQIFNQSSPVLAGSEWNACNYEELIENGITHILNVTSEIDSPFESSFEYLRYQPFVLNKKYILVLTDDLRFSAFSRLLPKNYAYTYFYFLTRIEVLDVPKSNLLRHWENTSRFIKDCRDSNGKVGFLYVQNCKLLEVYPLSLLIFLVF